MSAPEPAAGSTETWALSIKTPIGRVPVTLHLVEGAAGALTGTAEGEHETVDLVDLTRSGDRLTWSQQVRRPMRLNLAFDVRLDGDKLEGTSKAGRLPGSKVTGTRTA